MPDQTPPNFDTEMGAGGSERFPITPWSAIMRAGTVDPKRRREALERLLTGYWRPIYVYIRRKWNRTNEDAKDLTQAFVANMLEKDIFAAADKDRGRFRALLRTSLENFLRNQYAETQAQRRGGGRKVLSLELAMENEGEVPVRDDATPEDLFRTEWVRTIFSAAVEQLRKDYETEGKQMYRRVFERYQLGGEEGLSYEAVAKEFGLKVWDVTNYLADARRRLREIITTHVKEYCVTEDEYREEMNELFGG
jgi:RNA polymerase sigma-70 factor (ECF subfamily)